MPIRKSVDDDHYCMVAKHEINHGDKWLAKLELDTGNNHGPRWSFCREQALRFETYAEAAGAAQFHGGRVCFFKREEEEGVEGGAA